MDKKQPLDVFEQNYDIITAAFYQISSSSKVSDSEGKADPSYHFSRAIFQSSLGTNATSCPSKCTIKKVPATLTLEVATAPERS